MFKAQPTQVCWLLHGQNVGWEMYKLLMNDEYHLTVLTEPDEQEVASTLEVLVEDTGTQR